MTDDLIAVGEDARGWEPFAGFTVAEFAWCCSSWCSWQIQHRASKPCQFHVELREKRKKLAVALEK